MKVFYDFHIHSAASPCAENDMTPNNVINMAKLKGLDVIAITDHNTCENLEAFSKCAEKNDILFIPGMELETSEEIHLICLFRDLSSALKMQEIVYNSLSLKENIESIFGQQYVFNEDDSIIKSINRLLASATSLSIDKVFEIVRGLDGVVIPSHVDRESYSILSSLGGIPKEVNIKTLEISKNCNKELFLNKMNFLKNYRYIVSSDAHTLGDILERVSYIEVEEPTIDCIFKELRGNL